MMPPIPGCPPESPGGSLLIVQIPCFNEEATLAETVASIPRQIPGIARVEVLVIDDGSTDRTSEVARSSGVDHLYRHPVNRGLAAAFQTGIDHGLRLGADVIVNTDADHQYPGADIPRLVAPILEGRADLVIGDRQTATLTHFSRGKRLLQRMGSAVARLLSGLDVPDAVSGFRALSREAALRTTILSSFSYTTEQLIQAGMLGLAVESVPVTVNPTRRRSRLFRNLPQFIASSAGTMVRTYTLVKPLRVYSLLGGLLAVGGILPIVRFLYFYAIGEGGGHVQSLVLGGVLLTLGFVTMLVGVLAELVSSNRRLSELALEKIRRLEIEIVRAGPAVGTRDMGSFGTEEREKP